MFEICLYMCVCEFMCKIKLKKKKFKVHLYIITDKLNTNQTNHIFFQINLKMGLGVLQTICAKVAFVLFLF